MVNFCDVYIVLFLGLNYSFLLKDSDFKNHNTTKSWRNSWFYGEV